MTVRRRITVNRVGETALVVLVEPKILDSVSMDELRKELFSLLDTEPIRRLVLDFSAVEFLSSAALHFLVLFDKKVRELGGDLRLYNLRPEVLELFSITRLNRVFRIINRFPDDDGDLEASAGHPRDTPPDGLTDRAEQLDG